MPIQLTDKLAYPNRGTVSHAFAYGVSKGAKRQEFLMRYLSELYRLCAKYNLDFSILVAQSANETDAWRSQIWLLYGNPAGIGVTGTDTSAGTNYSLIYKTGEDAARAHVVHMFAYVRGTITTGAGELSNYIALDPRYDAVTGSSKLSGSVATIADFNVNGRWALLNTPPPYGQRIVNSGMDVWGDDLPDQGDPPVTTPSTPEIPVEGEPVALEILNRVIGVQANAPSTLLNAGAGRLRPIIHNTDNPNTGADALMHAQFVKNGGGISNVSFHFAVDSKRAVQIVPLNRVAYHASDGCDSRTSDTGCFDGIAIENCDNADGDIDKTFDNLAELLACIEFGDPRIDYGGRPLADFKGFIDRTLGHHDTAWDGKWCPSDFLNKYGDPGYKTELKKRAKQKLAAKQGTTPAPDPVTYAKPQPPPAGDNVINTRIFLAHSVEYTTKKDVTPRLYADPTSSPTGPTIKAGTKVKTSHVVSDVGESADLTAVLVDGSRIPVAGVLV